MSGIQQIGQDPTDPSDKAGTEIVPGHDQANVSMLVHLRTTIEREIVPQLLSLHSLVQHGACRHGLEPPHAVMPGADGAGAGMTGIVDPDRLAVELALESVGPHADRVAARLDRLLEGGADPEQLCLHVLAPAARHLGQLWTDDQLDFVDVTLGAMRLERALRGLLAVAPSRRDAGRPPAGAPTILMMPLPGNQHTFGLSMAADFFRRAGWTVSDGTVCGSPGSASDTLDGLQRFLRTHWVDAIGLAVSCETQSERLQNTLRMIRAASCNNRIRIALGGPLFLVQPEMASRFDADLVVTDGAQAPFQLAALLPESNVRHELPGPDAIPPA